MSPIIAVAKTIIFLLALEGATAEVQCNSSVIAGANGTCTGQYCFNIENQITGCVNFYRQIRDDNIACGQFHILGKMRRMCVCTQAYCGKYDVANMPNQVLADVNCTDDSTEKGYCSPGPCYVGNDLARYGLKPTDTPAMQQTCMPDWFAVTNFKQLIVYEVPPLKNHSACFFDNEMFNCYCKDPGCNNDTKASLPPAADADHYTCRKMACSPDKDPKCNETTLGTETCIGQMCYYLKASYDFSLDGKTYKETNIVRDCLNYSHAKHPLDDLSFVTGFEFGKSSSVFYPCRQDLCNEKTSDPSISTPAPASTSTFRFSILLMVICSIALAVRS